MAANRSAKRHSFLTSVLLGTAACLLCVVPANAQNTQESAAGALACTPDDGRAVPARPEIRRTA